MTAATKTKTRRLSKVRTAPKTEVYITTGGQIISDADLKRFEMPQSKQLEPSQAFKGLKIVNPPFDISKLLQWMDQSVSHNAAVRTKVQDAVGIGWHLEQIDDAARDEDRLKLEEFFDQVNPQDNINMLSKKVYTDFEGSGNGYIEVARDKDGIVTHLYHVPAPTVRVHVDRTRFVQVVNTKKVWFKCFGDERTMDSRTGEFKEVSNPDHIANELIHLKMYSHRSAHYGLPEWLPAIFPMFGEIKEKEYNINFFSSFGIPAYAVILEGIALDPKVEESIKTYFETEVKGNPHRTMVMSHPTGAKITFEALNVQSKEASFRLFRRDNRDDILTAHRVPPYRAGIVVQGQLGGRVASEVDRIYLSSVIDPRQQEYEWIINNMLIEKGLQIFGWTFEFDDILIDDRQIQADIDAKYFSIASRTPNEIRILLGLDPYDGGDNFFLALNQIPVGTDTEKIEKAEGLEPQNGQVAPPGYVLVGKGKPLYQDWLKQRRGLSDVVKAFEKIARQYERELLKEFARQEVETQKWARDEKVLERVREVAMQSSPESFDQEKRAVQYETIEKQASDADLREIDAILSGWRTRVDPERMAEIAEKFAIEAGSLGGVSGLRRLGLSLKFDLTNERIREALQGRGRAITGPISDKTLQDFRSVLVREYYERGSDVKRVQRAVKGLFTDTYKGRSRTIARTETGIAQAEVQAETYRRNEVQQKEWQTFIDGNERPFHLAAHGQRVPMDQPYTVGGEFLDRPLDPAGSGFNIINCRCDQIPIVAERPEGFTPWAGD